MTTGRDRRPALFLDRDGVIIENCDNYVREWRDVVFIPPALAALAAVAGLDYRFIIVTNQSAIGRGLLSPAEVLSINERIEQIVAENGGRIDATYICPHAPDSCECRKPKPGLLLQAAAEWDIDLGRSYMIGDALSDMAAGRAAGVASTVMVRTGRGRQQEALMNARETALIPVVDDLAAALALLGLLPEPGPQP